MGKLGKILFSATLAGVAAATAYYLMEEKSKGEPAEAPEKEGDLYHHRIQHQ